MIAGFDLNVTGSNVVSTEDTSLAGKDVVYTNTQMEADSNLNLESGGDTTLKGVVASGKQVTADVGGNLKKLKGYLVHNPPLALKSLSKVLCEF